jgi:hypothetical protein
MVWVGSIALQEYYRLLESGAERDRRGNTFGFTANDVTYQALGEEPYFR